MIVSESSDLGVAHRALWVRLRPHRFMILAYLTTVVIGVAILSPYALFTAVSDGVVALILLGPAALGGLWVVALFRLGPMSLRWHLLLGAALGIGVESLVVLGLGLGGLLARPLQIGLLTLAAVLGVMRLARLLQSPEMPAENTPASTTRWEPALWLLTAPFLIAALLAAANAPGFIWSEEGFGYDVLEYHLQMPKEYWIADRIAYAPHNVYANFPANVEMLYLLAMILRADDLDSGTTANMIHLMLGALTVFAAWVAGRELSPRAGRLAAICVATTGWLSYLSGLAYVEHGVLFLGMTACALTCRLARSPSMVAPDPQPQRESHGGWFLVGALAGLACGCKYTAVPMIALPVLCAGIVLVGSFRARAARAAVIILGTLTAFSPWLVKNQVMTGNPVFPLANSIFQAHPPGWDKTSDEQWQRGHSASSHHEPRGNESALASQHSSSGVTTSAWLKTRARALWDYVLGDHAQRFGPLIFLLAIASLIRPRYDRTVSALWLVLVLQLAVWLGITHMYARFAVVTLIPLALLTAHVAARASSVRATCTLAIILVAGAAWNFAFVVKSHAAESPRGAPVSWFYDGELPGYEYLKAVNHELPADAKLLIVGDAKAFYVRRPVDYRTVFNRSPFIEALESTADDARVIEWLRREGFTHVLVNWSEVRRLAATYGFSAAVTPDRFDRLTRAGLKPWRTFNSPIGNQPYIDIFEVPK